LSTHVTHDEAQALPVTMAGGCAVVRLEMILSFVDLDVDVLVNTVVRFISFLPFCANLRRYACRCSRCPAFATVRSPTFRAARRERSMRL